MYGILCARELVTMDARGLEEEARGEVPGCADAISTASNELSGEVYIICDPNNL